MIRASLLFVATVFIQRIAYAQNAGVKDKFLLDSLAVITKRVEKLIIPGRYMEGKLVATTSNMLNWEGIPVSLYEYKETPRAPVARVYLADASAGKIATWIITSCVGATGKLAFKHTEMLIAKINDASNGQFPVLGVVVENNYPFVFKDGVTIGLTEKITSYLDPGLIKEDNINKTKSYGRIISTTREQYRVLFPGTNVAGHNWRTVVREEYKKALSSDTNNLMLAWAKANLK